MKKILKNWEQVLIAVCLGLMCIFVMANTVARTTGVFTEHLRWSDEASRMLMIWMGFLACGQACKDNSHYRMTAIVEKITGLPGRAVELLSEFISLLVMAALAYFGFMLAHRLQLSGQVSPVMHIPIWLAYLSIPASMTDMLIHSMIRISRTFRHSAEGGEVT